MGTRLWIVNCCLVAVVASGTVWAEELPPKSPPAAQAKESPGDKSKGQAKATPEQPSAASPVDKPDKKEATKSTDPKTPKEPDVAQTPVAGLKPVVSKTGVKYWDIKVGDGESPTSEATVIMNFSSWLKDGTLWYSSLRRGAPARIVLSRVPPGLTEGVLSMKVGGRRRIEIPAEQAFGSTNTPPGVPPDADLVYEIDLVAVKERIKPPVQTDVAGIKPTTTPSGLKFWDIKVGTGKMPKTDSIVTVDYSGWLTSGKLFQNTIERDRPESFRLNKVVKGMAEGIKSMRIGGKRRLEVPPELGYGKEGQGRYVPPNSRLVFEVELLDIQRPLPPPKQTSVEGIKPVILPSGVKYWDIKVGTGRTPDSSCDITAHYTGWLTDGTQFDSSIDLGQPLIIRLGAMIKGWGEGLKTMKVGGKRRLWIPYELGFGEQGKPPRVPPKATLIYEVELLDARY